MSALALIGPPVSERLVFARSDWACEGASVRPEPGTWCPILPPLDPTRKAAMIALHRKGIWAILCCPSCRAAPLLSTKLHVADRLGVVTPAWVCSCGIRRVPVLDQIRKGRILFAVAIEGVRGARIEYCHASSVNEARKSFGRPDPGERVVSVARAIGAPVTEKGLVILR